MEQANSSSAQTNSSTNTAPTCTHNVKIDKTEIETIFTTEAATVDAWIKDIRSSSHGISELVGLDTEWKIEMEENKKTKNRLALLQLCVDKKCLLFQICRMDVLPASLGEFLLDGRFTFVGVEIGWDLDMLKNECDLGCAKFEDLWMVAKEKWPKRWNMKPGLFKLASEIAGVEIKKNKAITRSDWGKKELSLEQIRYACLDAYVSYKLGVELQIYFSSN